MKELRVGQGVVVAMCGIAAVAWLVGCEVKFKTDATTPTTAVQATPVESEGISEIEPGVKRFVVESHGKFKAGFGNNEREILLITDKLTGKTYIGITGVGISELRRETSTAVTVDGEGSPSIETTSETVER